MFGRFNKVRGSHNPVMANLNYSLTGDFRSCILKSFLTRGLKIGNL